jgi:hypothetical protein|tara:strand:- start:529 stop:906 length:378 start_codon:yes stop_codon:yes gene_type:complete
MNFDEPIDNEKFLLYAMKSYDNPTCQSTDEFYEDLNRIKYVKRLAKKYKIHGILRERLLLNHIIVLNNVFGKMAPRLLFYSLEVELHDVLKTLLVYLNFLPKNIPEVDIVSIPIEQSIVAILRDI